MAPIPHNEIGAPALHALEVMKNRGSRFGTMIERVQAGVHSHSSQSLTEEVMMKLVALLTTILLAGSIAAAQTATPKVTERQVNQQKRIQQGVKSGELTKKEAVRLQTQQARIQATKKNAKSDGVVTAKERAKLNAMQNKASRNIYRQKHDDQKSR